MKKFSQFRASLNLKKNTPTGSYKIELEDGEMQTIYYISDSRGHRISIDVPFPEDDEVKRPPPTRKPQQKKFSLDEQKAFEENRIDNGAARKGKVQEQQAVTAAKPTKIETATQKQTVTEKQTPIEKQTTAAVPKFIRKLEPYNRPGAKLLTKKLIVTSTTEAAASPEEIVEETSAKTQSQSSKEQEESKELKSDAEEGNLEQNDQEGAAEAEDYE